jgi:signal transduction histidine kinase
MTSLGLWIFAAAMLAVLVQAGVCFWRELGETDQLARHFVKAEADAIAKTLFAEDGTARNERNPLAARLLTDPKLVFRVSTADNRVLFAHNADMFPHHIAQAPKHMPNGFVLRRLDPDRFIYVGAIEKFVADRPLWIEISTVANPSGYWFRAIVRDVYEDAIQPIAIATSLQLLITLLGLHLLLRPFRAAALQVEARNPAVAFATVDIDGLPIEVASYGKAVNDLVTRARTLVQSNERMANVILHELRRPLTAMKLELATMSGNQAASLRNDLARLETTVDGLLELARAKGQTRTAVTNIVDLEICTRAALTALSTLATNRGATVEIRIDRPDTFAGHSRLVEEAICNVVENAIKHAGEAARILITCGPGRTVTIDDDGPGICPSLADTLTQPFVRQSSQIDGWGLGLSIVKETLDLHQGEIKIERAPLGGARFQLLFHYERQALRTNEPFPEPLPARAPSPA